MARHPIRLAAHLAVLAAPLALAACVVGPDYHRPALPASASLGADATSPPAPMPVAGAAPETQPELVAGMDVPAEWWAIFHSAPLDALVAQALKASPTIEAANQTLRAAQEQVRAQRGAYFPTVAVSVQPSRAQFAPNLASPLQSNNDLYNLTTTQLSIAYTPDLFGANHRAVESLAAQADQQRFTLEAARLTLASNVVLAAIQDASLRAQIDETDAIIDAQQKTLASFQRQRALGQVSEADLAAQQALTAQARAALPPLEKSFRVNRDLLAALMGLTPGEAPDVGFDFRDLALPEQLPLSLPGQLVEHRPDVRIAEAQLHAASAEVGVAIAARLPNIEIDANAGSAALGLAPVFGSASNFWSLAATLTQPVFQGGTLLHRQRAAEAAYDAAAAQYRATVVGAFQSTADVLHALWTDADGLNQAEAAEVASHRSLTIARSQLGLGDVSPLTVLAAEQTDRQAQIALVQARASRYADVAALFQALGGGWWNAPAPAPRPAGGR
jgi:NodT family efflux transporter outer membrane factor (OMF) lipoprotein